MKHGFVGGGAGCVCGWPCACLLGGGGSDGGRVGIGMCVSVVGAFPLMARQKATITEREKGAKQAAAQASFITKK
jgi:hypothetical protein